MKKSVYILPNLLTSGNIFCGVLAIFLALNGNGFVAAWMIFAAMIFDTLDGTVARLKNACSDFGVQYDSLSDMISFGMAPVIIVLQEGLKNTGRVGLIVSSIYCVCVALRLARYNVMTQRKEKVPKEKSDFAGLPSPAGAGFVCGFVIASHSLDFLPIIVKVLPVFMIVVSYLMVSNIRYPAFNKKLVLTRSPFFYFVSIVILMSIVVFQIEYFMLFIFSGYILSGLVLQANLLARTKSGSFANSLMNIARKIFHIKSQTLKDKSHEEKTCS